MGSIGYTSPMELYLTRNGTSVHPGREHKYNQRNDGYGIALQTLKDRLKQAVELGYYKNSLNNQSNYINYLRQHRFGDSDLHADIGARFGGITGYPAASVTPAILPTLTLGGRNVDFNISYAPEVTNNGKLLNPETWMANVNWRLPK